MRIMIADDERMIRAGLVKMIKDLLPDHTISAECLNGFEVLEQIAKNPPDLILMDMKMPGMNGLEATKKIKQKHPGIYIIVVSGYSDFEYVSQFIDNGICSYILKPIEPEKLIAAINKIEQKIESDKQRNLSDLQLRRELKKLCEIVPENVKSKILNLLDNKSLQKDNNTYIVKKALDYIHEHFNDKITLTVISKNLYISTEHLCRIFHANTNMTVSNYINFYRINKAKQYLCSMPSENINSIAQSVGFANPKYFSQQFKELVGMNPSEYRNKFIF